MSSLVIGENPRIFLAVWSTLLVEGGGAEEEPELGGAKSVEVVVEPSRGVLKGVDCSWWEEDGGPEESSLCCRVLTWFLSSCTWD